VSLAGALEGAAAALPRLADAIRPANGDPARVLSALEPGGAARLLAWLLEHDPEAGGELALAWADLEGGAAPIQGVDEASLGKEGRKALRRALHRLRSRGIEVAETPPAAHVATLPDLSDVLAAALVSPPDPSGAQLVVVVEPGPSGGARIFQGAIDLERGVLEFHVLSGNRSQARRLVRDLEANPRLGALPAPREALAALLARAADAQPADRALPSAFEDWRSRVARPPEGARTPGELAREALDSPLDRSSVRAVAERVTAGDLGPWPPPLEELRGLGEKVRQTAESPLLVDDGQRRSQVEQVIGDAVEGRYAGPAAERTAQRLEECAYAAWRRDRTDDARALLSAARAFREWAPRDNPAARALLERVLGPMLEALRSERSSSLLVRP
jgi:hypothetical protein